MLLPSYLIFSTVCTETQVASAAVLCAWWTGIVNALTLPSSSTNLITM
jgi:hypothetical protein